MGKKLGLLYTIFQLEFWCSLLCCAQRNLGGLRPRPREGSASRGDRQIHIDIHLLSRVRSEGESKQTGAGMRRGSRCVRLGPGCAGGSRTQDPSLDTAFPKNNPGKRPQAMCVRSRGVAAESLEIYTRYHALGSREVMVSVSEIDSERVRVRE